jgi:hypothetical protein
MPDSDFVLLESEDGYTFVVPRKVACASGTLRSMLDEEGECNCDFRHAWWPNIR